MKYFTPPIWNIIPGMKPSTSRGLFAAKLAIHFLLLLHFGLAAQTNTFNKTRLVNLKFNGLSHFTDSQAAAASGLHVGQSVGVDDLNGAANKLAQSGGFTHVAYRYSTDATGIAVQFDLSENQNLLPCIFDNFVWFSDDEIDQALRKSVPLYGKTVPEDGPTMDQISSALRGLLQSKSIPGDVEKLPLGAIGGSVQAMIFRVAGVSIHVKAVSFTGGSSHSVPELKSTLGQLVDQSYSNSDIQAFAETALVPIYRHHGFFRVTFGRATPTIQNSQSPGEVQVALSIPIQEGQQYSWGGAQWTGNQILKSEDLDRLLGMKPNEIADGDKITAGLQAVANAYSVQGYIDAAVQRHENIDDAALLVSYDVAIAEGIQYHMGQITFVGVPDSASKRLTGEWQLKPGAVYDGTYFQTQFMKKASWPGLYGNEGAKIGMALKRNPQTARVDVTITVR